MSLAGLILKDNLEEDCKLAVLKEDGLECHSITKNEEIVELIEENRPEILSVNVGTEERAGEMTKDEEELVDEGFSFIPNSEKKKLMKRLESLKAHITEAMGVESPEIIRFDPIITAKELAISGDSDLESLGVDTSNIKSAEMFDAALGTVTGRFYQQNQYEDYEIIIPSPIKDQEKEQGP